MPTRSGYTFGGWRVVQSQQQQQCSLSGFYPDGDAIGGGGLNSDGSLDINATTYRLTEYNTWAVEFSNGVLKGRVLCSSTNGTYAQVGNPDETGDGQYCWLAGTDFGNQCSLSSPSWVFLAALDDANDCALNCVAGIENIAADPAFRRAIFGVTQ